jgi:hypothetical protein
MKKWLMMVAAMVLLTGCKTIEYVPIETVRTDTLMVAHIVTDSVWVDRYMHDSVYIHERGDTVWFEKWHTRYVDRWRDRVTHDTIYKSKTDSVTVTREIEKPLTKSQRARLHLANIVLVMLGMVAIFFIVRFGNKIRKLR